MTENSHDYRAAPATEVGARGVVLIPEWWGLVDHIRQLADRFAEVGFHALAVDVFDGRTAADAEEGRALAQSIDRSAALDRVMSAVESLGESHGLDPTSIGVIGWCMGGSLAFNYASERRPAGAAVGFYGSPPPADELIGTSIPTLGIFGESDHVYPVDTIRAAAIDLRQSSSPHRFIIANSAGHGFFNDTRDSYDGDAAAWAWETVLLWFRNWLTP